MGASRLRSGPGEACQGLASQNRNIPAKPRLAKKWQNRLRCYTVGVFKALLYMQKKSAYRGGRNEGVPITRTNSKTDYPPHTTISLVGPSEWVYTTLVPDGHVAIWPYGHLDGFTWHPVGVRWIYGQTRPIKPYSHLTPKSTIWRQTLVLLYQS